MTLKWATSTDQLYALGNTQPSLDLQFATSKTLDDRVSGLPLVNHQRDASSGKSAGTYVGSDGLIKTSPVNKLRYSNEFTNGAWTKRNFSFISSSTTAPDGTATATTFSTPNTAFIYQDTSSVIGESYVNSIWIKGNANATIGLRKPGMTNTQIGDGSESINVTTEWQRFTAVTTSADDPNGRLLIDFRAGNGASVPAGFETSLWHAQTEEGTTATDYIPTTSTISGAPRFDHDPVTGESLGLLVEESRTNYGIDSENPAGWTVTNGASKQTFTAVTAPDGSILTQGFRLPDKSSRVYPTVSSPGTVVPVCSVYVRSVSGTATLNLFIQGAAVASDISVPSDRWLRIIGTSASKNVTAFSVRGNASQSEDVYIWGAQLEVGSFPTSYIPTSGSTVTRAGDVISITGTNFSNFYNNSEGTWFTDMALGFTNNAGNPYTFGGVYYTTVARSIRTLSNGTLLVGNSISNSLTVPSKTALAMKPEGYMIANDGVLAPNSYIVTTNSSYVPAGTQLRIAPSLGGLGRISRITYYPYRLADTTLQEITS